MGVTNASCLGTAPPAVVYTSNAMARNPLALLASDPAASATSIDTKVSEGTWIKSRRFRDKSYRLRNSVGKAAWSTLSLHTLDSRHRPGRLR
ncbi:hypothetical protein V2G26_002846 [Clonostachys chloroleuca]